MKKASLLFVFTLITSLCLSSTAYAWNHSIELGYGFSHDPNHSRYNNSGLLLSGDIFPLWRSTWTFLSITGSLGQLHTNSPSNKNVTTGALSIALRGYALSKERYANLPYLFASFGPALISHRHYGLNEQAKNFTIQSNLGFGIEMNHIDINFRLHHFSNANLARPNDGFNVLYLLSVGYLF